MKLESLHALLQGQKEANRLPPLLLFTGSVATEPLLRLAAALHANLPLDTGEEAMIQRLRGHHPDFQWVFVEKSFKIKEVQSLKMESSRKPWQDLHRYWLLGPLDRLTKEAANAVLKLLEEPPTYAYYFTFAKNVLQVPQTIRSRATIYTISNEADWLQTYMQSKDLANASWFLDRSFGDENWPHWFETYGEQLQTFWEKTDVFVTQLPNMQESALFRQVDYFEDHSDLMLFLLPLVIRYRLRHGQPIFELAYLELLLAAQQKKSAYVPTRYLWEGIVLQMHAISVGR